MHTLLKGRVPFVGDRLLWWCLSPVWRPKATSHTNDVQALHLIIELGTMQYLKA